MAGCAVAQNHVRDLRRAIPGVFRGFAQLYEAALAPGVLDVKTKELIALAIAVTRECDGCVTPTRTPRRAAGPPRRRSPRCSAW